MPWYDIGSLCITIVNTLITIFFQNLVDLLIIALRHHGVTSSLFIHTQVACFRQACFIDTVAVFVIIVSLHRSAVVFSVVIQGGNLV